MHLRILLATRPGSPSGDPTALPSDVMATVVDSTDELLRKLREEPFDLALVDDKLVEGPTTAFLKELRAQPDAPEVVVVEAGEEEPRSRLLAAGASMVLESSVDEVVLAQALAKVVARRRVQAQAELEVQRSRELRSRLSDFSTESPAMRRFLDVVRRVVNSDTTLLLLGETGVGKEYLARSIHTESPRSAGPFIAVNCAALPDSLLESELFGHVAGAFTGAHKARRGYFEQASGGVLFLDEVGELPPSVQVKLLRVLQERCVVPVGGEREIPCDVRVLAATNRNLKQEVEEGRFRSDLYFRLSVVALEVPPLRERLEDLRPLVESQAEHMARSLGRVVTGTTLEALAALRAYAWPGNVRELLNVVERAVLLTESETIGLSDLPVEVQAALGGAPGGASAEAAPAPEADEAGLRPYRTEREQVLEVFDRRYISHALRATGGRVGKAADLAGLTSRGLYEKMRRLGLRKEDFRQGAS